MLDRFVDGLGVVWSESLQAIVVSAIVAAVNIANEIFMDIFFGVLNRD